ncbi:helix-turn-helix domain-containing protein [Photobacterium sp. 2_MG-2023]|uniref:IS66 family insertion sequence element accessory protein TnpA n=1 Tax=Photobacterium sp. 2_MG-2023 TaxID=3062663 RepID=UPI0026E48DDA|nr:helix-turn-helix domain-containing protein [Photobacterium sp. 2_MG-2023]MDO6579748.1 helix-turn-helix domain-containing protein [Photobacterium sp. 2_MG-2023]
MLSPWQFCADNGISYQTFLYWSKRLRSPDVTQTLQPIVFDEHNHSQSESVIIVFANGIRAELPTILSAAQIKHWVGALQ